MDIRKSWGPYVPLIQDGYHEHLLSSIDELREHTTIYPPSKKVFYALQATPFNQVKVVILGQDPYHGPGQAHGLAFSVPEGIKAPPSLRNIFKEIQNDVYAGDSQIAFSTDLTRWAQQGVLLLNATLTVEAGKAHSHCDIGWQHFTDQIIASLSDQRQHLVFILWGRFAQLKESVLDRKRHCILKASHPSPLSAYRGYLGCRHFSKANAYLVKHGYKPIAW